MKFKRWTALLLALALALSVLPAGGIFSAPTVCFAAEASTTQASVAEKSAATKAENGSLLYDHTQTKYATYLADLENQGLQGLTNAPDQPVVKELPLDSYVTKDSGFSWETIDTVGKVLKTPAAGEASFQIQVDQSGLYGLRVTYYPLPGSGSAAVRSIAVDGKVPFYEASMVEFPRVWCDKQTDLKKDNLGNDILPMQTEAPSVETVLVKNNTGLSGDVLYFYLNAGQHTLTLAGVREPMALVKLQLETKRALPTYATVKQLQAQNGQQAAGQWVILQGEDASAKSDATLYPLNDKTSPLTSPVSDLYVRYNTIGGSKWQTAGQWIEWQVAVPKTGLYTISVRYKQNLKSNSTVYRRLYLDGNVPFAEADAIGFSDTSGFVAKTLGDSKNGAYSFFLTAGTTHTLRLEAVTGVFAPVLEEAQRIVNELNGVYREILMITGPSPDLYRDYNFPALIPDSLRKMTQLKGDLEKLADQIRKLTGWKNGSELSAILRTVRILDEMVKDDSTIAGRFSNFQDDISALATWVLDTKAQPLEIDCFSIGGGKEALADNGGFFAMAAYQAKQFLGSFTMDYNELGQVGGGEQESVTVWLQTGRDQSQIIRGLINQDFTPASGIGVKLQLVAAGSLLPAIIAKLGPDVALQLGQGDPMNYAFRNAVLDLSQMDGIDQVKQRFSPQALVPFTYDTHLYALPESQSFQMLFYRKDILAGLGITASDLSTWDGIFKVVVPELQKNYLSFGLLPSLNNYAMLLYQNGGSVYNQKGTSCLLNSSTSVSVFETFTRLYTEYLQPVAFDFANRFRTGQMPLAVMDFTAYNQLSVFAPEIAGLWAMSPLPSTVRADGTKDSSAILNLSSCVLFEYTKVPKAAWKFMTWWTDTKVQTQYGKNMESIMGTAARYNSANKEAFASVSWDTDVRAAINSQLSQVYPIPEVPGGYYTSRYFDFAYRDVVNQSAEARPTLNDAVKQINAEIAGKREEFGLS